MNQILITDKVYVTPELKRNKKLYKLNFIVSIILAIILFSYYVYAEYQRNEEDKSDEILAGIEVIENQADEDSTVKLEEGVLVVALDNIPQDTEIQEIDLKELMSANKKAGTKLNTKVQKTKNGANYTTVAVIEIPKINIIYPVIYSEDTSNKTTEDLLRLSVVKYWGPDANEQGNFCIVGHNYHNKRFFSKISTLKTGDSIYLTDVDNRTLEYQVYDKKVIEPDDLKCTTQLTNGQTEITLITCTMTGKQRTIVKARAVNID